MRLYSDKESEEASTSYIVTDNDDEDYADEVQCNTGNATLNQTNSIPEARTLNQSYATPGTGAERRKNTNEDKENAPTKEHTIKQIVDHKASKNLRSRYNKYP